MSNELGDMLAAKEAMKHETAGDMAPLSHGSICRRAADPDFKAMQELQKGAGEIMRAAIEPGLELHRDMDARRWAREFMETLAAMAERREFPFADDVIGKQTEMWMSTWFANALMAGFEDANRRFANSVGKDRLEIARLRSELVKARKRRGWRFGRWILSTMIQGANAPLADRATTTDGDGNVYQGWAIRLQPWKREFGQSAPQVALVIGRRAPKSEWLKDYGPGGCCASGSADTIAEEKSDS